MENVKRLPAIILPSIMEESAKMTFENWVENFQKAFLLNDNILVQDINPFHPICKISIHHQECRSSKQECNFPKSGIKFLENCFLKILLHFLIEDAMPFHLICKLLFYCQEYINIIIKKFKRSL